jgi:hypothetical protein
VPHVTGDRVKDTTTTTGTGNITVSGTAPTGFRTLSTVATADGDTLFLAIVGGSEWEVCLATRVSANVYSRATPLASSNSGSAVSFAAGTKDVFITLPASKIADNTAYASTWDGDTATAPSKNAVYDKLEASVNPGLIVGNWVVLHQDPMGLAAASAMAANTVYYTPVVFPYAMTLSDLGAVVTAAVGASNFALAIYAANKTTGRPTGNPLAATGNISGASATTVTADITGSNVTFSAGTHWLAYWSDAAVGLMGINFAAQITTATKIGSATAANVLTSTRTIHGVLSSETYNASAWPDATSETFTEITVNNRVYQMIGKLA